MEEAIQWADIVFTGEGCYDSQTASGKVVNQVQNACIRNKKEFAVVCGCTDEEVKKDSSIQIFDLTSRFGKNESMKNTSVCLEKLSEEIATTLL